MNKLEQLVLTGERALFARENLDIQHAIFEDGESPLKESKNINIKQSLFRYKYPFWYSQSTVIQDSLMLDGARAGIWYTDHIDISHTIIESPKTFRRSKDINLDHVDLPNASETLWMCDGITMNDVSAKGDYFAMNASNIRATGFRLVGNYAFDGCKNVEINRSQLMSKDAFWNCDNVVVRDSLITGEYIGWNSRNLTFINCSIESLQGFCYIDGLTLVNCRLLKTNLAFEYCSNIDVEVTTAIESVKNPISGIIRAKEIGEIIFDDPQIRRQDTEIKTAEPSSQEAKCSMSKAVIA